MAIGAAGVAEEKGGELAVANSGGDYSDDDEAMEAVKKMTLAFVLDGSRDASLAQVPFVEFLVMLLGIGTIEEFKVVLTCEYPKTLIRRASRTPPSL